MSPNVFQSRQPDDEKTPPKSQAACARKKTLTANNAAPIPTPNRLNHASAAQRPLQDHAAVHKRQRRE
jgi:hypothetical protein